MNHQFQTYYVRYVHDSGHPHQVAATSRRAAAKTFHNIQSGPGGPVAVAVWSERDWIEQREPYEFDTLDLEEGVL